MNQYYTALELHKILDMLSQEASNEKSKELALSLEPQTDLDAVKRENQKTADAFDLSVRFGTPTFVNFKNVTLAVKRAQSGAKLSLRELLDIAKLLNQIRVLADWYKQCSGLETSLNELFASLMPNKYLEERIFSSILSEDEVADSASSELAAIRRKITQSGARIRESLDKMVHSSTTQKYLQESIVTMRDGRYVLPVKAEHKSSVPGLVHDTSASGSTFFIEPISIVEANNDIRVLKGREQEEIDRIIAELSRECADCAHTITNDFDTCAELNLYFAKSNLGAKMRAACPEISDDGKIDLKNARHPLIEKDTVVPISLQLGYDYQALIITGPNTGGKTVALKTVGLLTAMTLCGLMIPVSDGSKISVFKNILVDIGDQQSIEQSLSTFSSHMNRVISILKLADPQSLVLLDELGSGTDPIEGAALAVSIIEKLKNAGSRLLVTTHYQELKLYAIENDAIQNASCEFNVATLQPTYRLIIGSPGKSNAFAISSRLGVPHDVIEHAKTLVSAENKHFEDVVEKLEQERQALEKNNAQVRALIREQDEKIKKLEQEVQIFHKNKDAEFEKARVQAMRIVESVRMQSENLLDELDAIRKQKDKEGFSQMAIQAKSKFKSTVNRMYNEANPVMESSDSNYTLPRPLKRGDHVLIADMNKKGILASEPDNSGFVFVQAGIMKTKINIHKLRLVEPDKIPAKPAVKAKGTANSGIKSKIDRKLQLELDIRGNNVDEGLHEAGMFLDNAVLSGVGLVTIIHGKGTGILRKAVHQYLSNHPSVKSYRLGVYGEGEDGVTIIELK